MLRGLCLPLISGGVACAEFPKCSSHILRPALHSVAPIALVRHLEPDPDHGAITATALGHGTSSILLTLSTYLDLLALKIHWREEHKCFWRGRKKKISLSIGCLYISRLKKCFFFDNWFVEGRGSTVYSSLICPKSPQICSRPKRNTGEAMPEDTWGNGVPFLLWA